MNQPYITGRSPGWYGARAAKRIAGIINRSYALCDMCEHWLEFWLRGMVGAMPRGRERSLENITKVDLRRLSAIAQADREDLFARKPHLRHYKNRVICVALCQGAALHFLDRKNGVKDFDVWTFYAARKTEFPPRRRGKRDFGESKFERLPRDPKRFVGRRVDLMGRSLPFGPSADPLEVIADYLSRPRTKSAKKLSRKAVVIIDPPDLRGKVAWDPR